MFITASKILLNHINIMDFTEENYANNEEETEKTCRTLWVGNLHPKVTCDLIAELFYQVIKNSILNIIIL